MSIYVHFFYNFKFVFKHTETFVLFLNLHALFISLPGANFQKCISL